MEPLIGIAIQNLPGIINAFKGVFQAAHPNLPEPTNEEVLAAFEAAFQSSRAKDETWLRAHPET